MDCPQGGNGLPEFAQSFSCVSSTRLQDDIRILLALHCHFWTITPLPVSPTFYSFTSLSPNQSHFLLLIDVFVLFLIPKSCHYPEGYIADPSQILAP